MLDQPPFFMVAGAKFRVCPFPRDNRPAGATTATWLGDPLTRDAVARCLAVRRDVIDSTLAVVFCVGPGTAQQGFQYRKGCNSCGEWSATHTAHFRRGDSGALYPRLKTNSGSPAERLLLEIRHVVFRHRFHASPAPAIA